MRREFLLFLGGRLFGVFTHTAAAREGRDVPVQCVRFVRKGESRVRLPSVVRCDPRGKVKDFHVAVKRPETCVSFHVHVSSCVSRWGHMLFILFFYYIFIFRPVRGR